jgi:hypothetical protein
MRQRNLRNSGARCAERGSHTRSSGQLSGSSPSPSTAGAHPTPRIHKLQAAMTSGLMDPVHARPSHPIPRHDAWHGHTLYNAHLAYNVQHDALRVPASASNVRNPPRLSSVHGTGSTTPATHLTAPRHVPTRTRGCDMLTDCALLGQCHGASFTHYRMRCRSLLCACDDGTVWRFDITEGEAKADADKPDKPDGTKGSAKPAA